MYQEDWEHISQPYCRHDANKKYRDHIQDVLKKNIEEAKEKLREKEIKTQTYPIEGEE